MLKVAMALAVLTFAHAAQAQTTDKNPLAQVKTLKCRFSIYASGSWSKTTQEPQAQVRQPETLSLEIDEIETSFLAETMTPCTPGVRSMRAMPASGPRMKTPFASASAMTARSVTRVTLRQRRAGWPALRSRMW